MKKVLVAICDEKSVTTACAYLGEEEGLRLFNEYVDEEVKKVMGDAVVEIEIEEPCFEHPDKIHILANVEE